MKKEQWNELLKTGKTIIKEASYSRVDNEIDEQEVIFEIQNSILSGKDKSIKLFQAESKKAIKKLKSQYPELKKKKWDELVDDAVEEMFNDVDNLKDFAEDFFGNVA